MLATSEGILGHSKRVKISAEGAEESASELMEVVKALDELLEFFQYEV